MIGEKWQAHPECEYVAVKKKTTFMKRKNGMDTAEKAVRHELHRFSFFTEDAELISDRVFPYCKPRRNPMPVSLRRKRNIRICKDGLAPVLEAIRNADGLIIGSPNYLGDVTVGFRAPALNKYHHHIRKIFRMACSIC